MRRFTIDEIELGIRKLQRRITDVLALRGVRYDDQRVSNVEHTIDSTILEVFGGNSPEYQRFNHHRISTAAQSLMPVSDAEEQRGHEQGIPQTVTLLEGLIHSLEEKRADLGHDSTSRIRAAFEGLDLHPRITTACANLYRDRHYSNAVLNASIALVNFVKEKSGRHDLDGAGLMGTVFSANSPILAFNDLSDKTDSDEQQGMMHLFAGAVLAFRNPRAHTLLDDSPEMALEYIALLSLLAKRLEKARRV